MQHQGPADVNELLRKTIAAREHFLDRHPHLRAYQAEIDRVLDKSGSHQGRMAVLATLMQGKLLEMQKALFKLDEHLKNCISGGNPLIPSKGNAYSEIENLGGSTK